MKKRPETFECPNCGAEVRVGRRACRECGSDDLTGWQSPEEIDYQSLDIPDGWGPEHEALAAKARSPRWLAWVAAVLVVCFVLWAVLR